jgi:DNA-binding GntR family transcriptional regulator
MNSEEKLEQVDFSGQTGQIPKAKATQRLASPDSLSIRVASQIRDEIYDGNLKPGAYLRELALAKDFQVSQSTIREALAHLEHHGLVVRVPNRSTTVALLSEKELAERTRVWCNLEQMAAIEAAMRADEQDIHGLEQAALRAEAAGAFEEAPDREFHLRIWQLAGNRTLYRVLNCLTLPLFVFRLHPNGGTRDESGMLGIVQALRTKDSPTIAKAVAAYHGMDGWRWHAAAAPASH